jgi:hypothetical protein
MIVFVGKGNYNILRSLGNCNFNVLLPFLSAVYDSTLLQGDTSLGTNLEDLIAGKYSGIVYIVISTKTVKVK